MKTTIIEPKILKGTRDFLPQDMAKRNLVMEKIRKVFEKYGYDTIETPIISYAETIIGNYGEEGDKLTYNFKDSGGRQIALPYDQTVPFARLFAANCQKLPIPFKRYQIQRVWRAEKPQKGRLREFYQCDVDIIGTKSLVAEVEIARIIIDVFKSLGFEGFKLRVNSRRLINALIESLKININPPDIIRAIDKWRKIGEEGVKMELLDKGMDTKAIAKMLTVLKSKDLSAYDTTEIAEFMSLCEQFKIEKKYIVFDPFLARGLDYYTGLTYEVELSGINLGSPCGGGRYDNLCGMFCKEQFSGVGVAFGFERIMLALEELGKLQNIPLNSKVLVTIFDQKSTRDSLEIYDLLLNANVNSEIYFSPEKLSKQFKYAEKKSIPFVIIRGPDEKKQNEITIKVMQSGKQKTVPLNQLISYINGYV